jgi:hypothetical protein
MSKIPDFIYMEIINNLESKLILINPQNTPNINSFNNLIKSELYVETLNLKSKLFEDSREILTENDCLTLVSSINLGCVNEIIMILSLMRTVSSIIEMSEIENIKEFILKYPINTEIISLYNLGNNIKKNLPNLKIFNLMKNNKILVQYIDTIRNIILKFNELYSTSKINKTNFVSDDVWNELAKLKDMNKLSEKSGKV